MSQSLSIFDIGLALTAILTLATAALWPLGRLRKPRRPSHCTFCNYDTNLEHAAPCSECGRQTGVPSPRKYGSFAWHARWLLPLCVIAMWITIETRHQRHAWWLLPNWMIIAVHDAVGRNASSSLDREFQLALIDRSRGIDDGSKLLRSLRLPTPLRTAWPANLTPHAWPQAITPAASRNAAQMPLTLQIKPASKLVGESWQNWYVPPWPITYTPSGLTETIRFAIGDRTNLAGRRSLFNLFDRPTLFLARDFHLTLPIRRVASIDELVTAVASPSLDEKVASLLNLRLIRVPGGPWTVLHYPTAIPAELEQVTLGLKLTIKNSSGVIAHARWSVRCDSASISGLLGLDATSSIVLLDVAGMPLMDEAILAPDNTFELASDQEMVLADPFARRYWQGSITLDAGALLRTGARGESPSSK